MKVFLATAVLGIGLFTLVPAVQDAMPSADAVITELKEGNAHHAAKRYLHPHQTAARQRELVGGQHPHAAILSCADSRVSPEIVFDQGLGDLFDVRIAGNVAGDTEMASLEYAAEHLHCPLVVVMGHQKCGAVSAAVEGGEAPGHLPVLIAAIKPAVDAAAALAGDRVENAVRINVQNVVRLLQNTPVLAEASERAHLKIVGAVYSLDTGKVDWLADGAAQKTSEK
jgi:carbonic anhydrase